MAEVVVEVEVVDAAGAGDVVFVVGEEADAGEEGEGLGGEVAVGVAVRGEGGVGEGEGGEEEGVAWTGMIEGPPSPPRPLWR